jgi:Zn-dependent protease/CBS domain-containing protein
MKWSIYTGRISGIKLFIHWTFVFFLVWIAIRTLRAGGTAEEVAYTLFFILSVFLCITLHELGHALMGKRLGYTTKSITLLPIGGVAQLNEIPENPKHELLVAAAGPVVNFVIAGIIAPFIYYYGYDTSDFTMSPKSAQMFFVNLFTVNISLGLFNLIPAFPMDGGRILRALIALVTKDRVKATNIASVIGKIAAVIFFIIGAMSNPLLAIIAVFIFMMAHTENEMVKSRFFLHDFTVADVVMKKFFTLNVSDKIADAIRLLLDVQATDFLVLDNERIAGTLSRDNIIQALTMRGVDSNVSEAMNPKVKILEATAHLESVYTELIGNGNTIMPVVDNGKLIGVVDGNNILEFIMVKSARDKNRLPLGHF